MVAENEEGRVGQKKKYDAKLACSARDVKSSRCCTIEVRLPKAVDSTSPGSSHAADSIPHRQLLVILVLMFGVGFAALRGVKRSLG